MQTLQAKKSAKKQHWQYNLLVKAYMLHEGTLVSIFYANPKANKSAEEQCRRRSLFKGQNLAVYHSYKNGKGEVL